MTDNRPADQIFDQRITHRCIALANERLAKDNTQLSTCETINFTTGAVSERLLVSTSKLDDKKRGKAKPVFAAYCPMCGDKL